MSEILGKLERVDPRTVWKHEAHDFTPWLVENIDQLGELLGMELEVILEFRHPRRTPSGQRHVHASEDSVL